MQDFIKVSKDVNNLIEDRVDALIIILIFMIL
jgi:hypothetical protein